MSTATSQSESGKGEAATLSMIHILPHSHHKKGQIFETTPIHSKHQRYHKNFSLKLSRFPSFIINSWKISTGCMFHYSQTILTTNLIWKIVLNKCRQLDFLSVTFQCPRCQSEDVEGSLVPNSRFPWVSPVGAMINCAKNIGAKNL